MPEPATEERGACCSCPTPTGRAAGAAAARCTGTARCSGPPVRGPTCARRTSGCCRALGSACRSRRTAPSGHRAAPRPLRAPHRRRGAGRPARPGARTAGRRCARRTAERLAETLRSWLLHQGRRDDVAADLFVHPQTVRYRMGQLRELYGDRLTTRPSVLDLTVALAGPRAAQSSSGHRPIGGLRTYRFALAIVLRARTVACPPTAGVKTARIFTVSFRFCARSRLAAIVGLSVIGTTPAFTTRVSLAYVSARAAPLTVVVPLTTSTPGRGDREPQTDRSPGAGPRRAEGRQQRRSRR